MKLPELTLSAENGPSSSLGSCNTIFSLGRRFVHREFGILDPGISRTQCQIRWKGRNFWIRDGKVGGINSLGGTKLDGKRLPYGQWLPIPSKAVVHIGSTIVSVSYENPYSTEFDLMISYSHKDREAVTEIYRSMHNLGVRPWMDQRSQEPASHYKEEIEKILTGVKAVAVFWGGDGMGNTQAAEVEIVKALHIHKRLKSLFLVILPGSEDPNWGLFLDNIDYYDLRKADEHQRLVDALVLKLLPEKVE